MIKLIGIALILISTAATGAAMVGGVHATLDQTRALQQLLQLMRSEIQYHLTPLPEIFASASKTISGPSEPCVKTLPPPCSMDNPRQSILQSNPPWIKRIACQCPERPRGRF